MTPSMIKINYMTCSITPNTMVDKDANGNVSIHFSHDLKLSCNRPEDFENLIALAQKALELFK